MATYNYGILRKALEDGAIDNPPLWANSSVLRCALILKTIFEARENGLDLEQLSAHANVAKNTAAILSRFLADHDRIVIISAGNGGKNTYYAAEFADLSITDNR